MLDDVTNKILSIVHDPEVQKLSVMLGQFNPFDVLKIEKFEIRYTNTLAWLLDPAGNHGLGDSFLRSFIAGLGSQELAKRFECASDQSVKVTREARLGSKLLDILIDGDKWLLAIEAKLSAREGHNQLKVYRELLEGKHKDKEFVMVYVFLTIDGDLPGDDVWLDASWKDNVIPQLEHSLDIHKELSPYSRSFIESYLQTLRRHAKGESDSEILAAKIVKKSGYSELLAGIKKQRGRWGDDSMRLIKRYSKTIERLQAQIRNPLRARANEIEDMLKSEMFTILEGSNPSYIQFVPAEWLNGEWSEEFKSMLATRQARITFEVTNRQDHVLFKLLVLGLGVDAQDDMANARRELVSNIHKDARNRVFFPAAFLRNSQPRAASPVGYTLYSKKIITRETVDNIEGVERERDGFQKQLREEISRIKNNTLKALEEMMKGFKAVKPPVLGQTKGRDSV